MELSLHREATSLYSRNTKGDRKKSHIYQRAASMLGGQSRQALTRLALRRHVFCRKGNAETDTV